MASIVNATDVVVKIGSTVIGCAQSAEFSVEREMDEATCFASGGWKQVSPGQKSWSGSFSAVLRVFEASEEAANISFDDLYAMINDGTEVSVEYSIPGGTFRYGGKAYVSSIAFDQPDSGVVTWSADYTGNGAFDKVTGA